MVESHPDDLDRAILYHLQENGRRAITDIADAIGVSDNTVRNRMQAMEEADIITGYSVDVDYDRVGIPHHYVFICTAGLNGRERCAAEARTLPGVTGVTTYMTGTANLSIVAVRSTKAEITDLTYAIDDLGLHIEREHLIWDKVSQPYSGFQPPDNMALD